jgi:Ca2+-binding EF-hand superfamily protein
VCVSCCDPYPFHLCLSFAHCSLHIHTHTQALTDQIGETSADIEVDAVFSAIDDDNSGYLSYKELIAW